MDFQVVGSMAVYSIFDMPLSSVMKEVASLANVINTVYVLLIW